MYHREFILSSCRFNGQDVYEKWNLIREPHSAPERLNLLLLVGGVLSNIHGHNFRIVVEIDDYFVPSRSYLIDDVVIEKMVMKWNNTNLSVHPDFRGLRATTENMTHILSRKVARLLMNAEGFELNTDMIGPTVIVTVHETDQIYATDSIDVVDLVEHRELMQEQAYAEFDEECVPGN